MWERFFLFFLVSALFSSIMYSSTTAESKVFASQEDLPEGMALYVNPQKSVVVLGSTFTVNVSIANVPLEGPRLLAYEFKLYYNKTVLEGISIELPEGHFLTPEIDPNDIYILECDFYQEDGYAYVAVTQGGVEEGNTGGGTLVVVTFKASLQGNSTIEIHDELLLTPDSYRFWPDEYEVVNGFVEVVPPEDLNLDGEINIKDLALVGSAFGSYPGHPRWNPTADVNKDDTINILDLAFIARNIGKMP
jgi:hypothetical protein